MRNSPCFIVSKQANTTTTQHPSKHDNSLLIYLDVQRHFGVASAKSDERDRLNTLDIDLSFFPEELHSVYGSTSSSKKPARSTADRKVTFTDTLARLQELESQEASRPKTDKDDEETANADEEEVEEEEELEDDTDYNLNYFDNGEDYGDYDGGGVGDGEGPVY